MSTKNGKSSKDTATNWTLAITLLAAAVLLSAAPADAAFKLNSDGTFSNGKFVLGVNTNGGFWATCNGKTIIDGSGIFTGVNGWMPYYYTEITQRKINISAGSVIVKGRFTGTDITFSQGFYLDGERLNVKIELENADWNELDWAAFEFKFPVDAYKGLPYKTNVKSGSFPQTTSKYELLYGFRTIEVAPGVDGYDLKFSSSSSDNLCLADDRYHGDNTYQVHGTFERTSNPSFWVTLTPPVGSSTGGDGGSGGDGGGDDNGDDNNGGFGNGGYIIHVNQVGYGTNDEKWAIVENGKNRGSSADARLQRKFENGWRTVAQLPIDAEESRWGSHFIRFDFSDTTKTGTYRIRFENSYSPVFKIGKNALRNLHSDTIARYFPIQMSHIKVFFGELGHDVCFMDDGIHVGANFTGPDHFKSFALEAGSRPGVNLGLNLGGFHDAGDYDINVANNSYAVLMMSWAFERYRDKSDNYGIKWSQRRLDTSRGNGVPDMVEQISWGAEWLLSMQTKQGRVYDGVVSRTHDQWCKEEAPEKKTDGKVYIGSAPPRNSSSTSSKNDDRIVFTNTTTPNMLKFIAATSAASRAVFEYDYELSNRLVDAAEKAWAYFRTNSQNWTGQHDQYKHGKEQMMMAAAAELYRTTGKKAYLNYIINNKGWISEMSVQWPGYINSFGNWFALPFLARVDGLDADLNGLLSDFAQRWVNHHTKQENSNIFGINLENLSKWWGCNSDFLGVASTYAILREEFPSIVPAKRGKRYLNWVLGLHPGPNYSFVTGWGDRQPRFTHSQLLLDIYGGAPGGIPGGVVPGLQLSSDGKSLMYSDDRQKASQNEYTLDSAAGFLYAALAWQ